MDWFLIILGIFIYLGVIGFLFDFNLQYDVTANDGILFIRLFKVLPIARVKLKIEGNALNFSRIKKKAKSLKFEINAANIHFLEVLKDNLVHRVYISKLDINGIIILDNPAIASLVSSTILLILSIMRFRLCRWQRDIDVTSNIVTGFDGSKIVVFLDTTIVISIIDLAWAVVKTIFERKKNGKKFRQFNI